MTQAKENANTMLAMARKAKAERLTSQALTGGMASSSNFYGDSREQQDAKRKYSLNTGWTYASVRPIAVRAAKQPFRIGQVTKENAKGAILKRRMPDAMKSLLSDDAGVELLETHPLLEAINDPNEWMVEWTLKFITAQSLQLTGRAFWWIVDSPRRKGFDIWPLPASWVTPVHDKGFRAAWSVRFNEDREPIIVSGDRMAYFYLPDSSDPFASRAPMDAALPAVETSEAIRTAQRATFDNSAMPALAFVTGEVMGPNGEKSKPQLEQWQREQISQSLNTLFKGVKKWGRFIVLDSVISDVKPVSNKPMEMDFMDSSKMTKEEIMQIFGVNEIVAGAVLNANRASAATATDLFLDNVVNPLLTMMSQVINQWVLPLFDPRPDVLCWIEEAKSLDPELRLRELEWLCGIGGLVVDEGRAELGFAPMPNGKGNVIVRSMAHVVEPVDRAGEELDVLLLDAPDSDEESELPVDEETSKLFY